MAGPGVGVLFRTPASGPVELEARSLISTLSADVQGDSFSLADRPFILGFGEEHPGELQELGETTLPRHLGWMPQGTMWLAAMCNGLEDHRLLAEVCLAIAERLDGIVDYGGVLRFDPLAQRLPSVLTQAYEFPPRYEGTLLAVPHGRLLVHYSDCAFLRWWMQQAEFRMVK